MHVNVFSECQNVVTQTPSFVRRSSEQRTVDMWSTAPTGDWSTDCSIGRVYAEEVLREMTETNNPSYLGHVVKAMIGHGVYGGIEVGFMQRIAEAAIR